MFLNKLSSAAARIGYRSFCAFVCCMFASKMLTCKVLLKAGTTNPSHKRGRDPMYQTRPEPAEAQT